MFGVDPEGSSPSDQFLLRSSVRTRIPESSGGSSLRDINPASYPSIVAWSINGTPGRSKEIYDAIGIQKNQFNTVHYHIR